MKKLLSVLELKHLKKAKTDLKYVCVNCGIDVQELYKKNETTAVLKILNCERCNQTADKYVEFENLIILIDLILMRSSAYRHVIYNTHCKSLWKLAVIIVLLESYCLWVDTFATLSPGGGSSPHHFDPFLSEKGFYLASFQIILDNVLFFLLLRLLTLSHTKTAALDTTHNGNLNQPTTRENITHHPPRNLSVDLIKAITLASIGKFFFLPIIIWKENSTAVGVAIHLGLVFGYFLLSLIQVHSVVSVSTRFVSSLIVILAFVVKTYLLEVFHISSMLKSFLV